MRLTLNVLCCVSTIAISFALTKIVVPTSYKEFENGVPDWITDDTLHHRYGYSVFVYQKVNSSASNFAANQVVEGGAYLRYIVDHYDNFPDVAVFVLANPEDHHPHWLSFLGCLSPKASYFNFNHFDLVCGYNSGSWNTSTAWIDQCWRDVLQITWQLEDNVAELNRMLPMDRPIYVCYNPGQQFMVSRDQVHQRPLEVWKKLYHINSACQGLAMEVLSHVIFGGRPLVISPTDEFCHNFKPYCLLSVCSDDDDN